MSTLKLAASEPPPPPPASDRDCYRIVRQADGSVCIQTARGASLSLSRQAALRLAARLIAACSDR